jgi:hypothetical protein
VNFGAETTGRVALMWMTALVLGVSVIAYHAGIEKGEQKESLS